MQRCRDRMVALALYRALARRARTFDADPALKALVAPPVPRRVYDHDSQRWHPSASHDDRRGLGEAMRAFLDGECYRPNHAGPGPSVASVARSGAAGRPFVIAV